MNEMTKAVTSSSVGYRLIQGLSVDRVTERVVEVGEVWRNQPGVVHTLMALEDSEVLEVSTPHLDDVVRLRDDYGREGTNAP
jgi:hypothetical protein